MADQSVSPSPPVVIQVGDGRGFVVEGRDGNRCVITAGHCLPHLPQACSYDDDGRVYPNLLGPIGGESTVWAECLFVDPVADIAVLGAPDYERLPDEAAAYRAFVERIDPLRVG